MDKEKLKELLATLNQEKTDLDQEYSDFVEIIEAEKDDNIRASLILQQEEIISDRNEVIQEIADAEKYLGLIIQSESNESLNDENQTSNENEVEIGEQKIVVQESNQAENSIDNKLVNENAFDIDKFDVKASDKPKRVSMQKKQNVVKKSNKKRK